MERPLLSIGMIVKNEIRCVEKCLQALQPLRDAVPCQLVIADTGSNDGTREVAQQYADLLIDFPWTNDFAAARNAVMDRCTGKWYLSVDADEYLVPDLKELVAFLWGKHPKNLIMAYVIQRNHRTRAMDGKYGDFPAPRLIRMDTGARYVGSIHESWILPADAQTKILGKTIFNHDGYAFQTPEQAQKKAKRNLKLLREELEKNPRDLRRLNQCVESSVPFPQERMSYLQQAMDLFQAEPELARTHYGMPLCRYSLETALMGKLPQARAWLKWVEEQIPQSSYFKVDIACCAAVYFLEEKEYETALSWADRYLTAQAECRKRRNAVLFETRASSLDSWDEDDRQRILCVKGECLARLGREEEAMEVLLPIQPEHMPANGALFYLQAMECLKEVPAVQTRVGEVLAPIFTAQPQEDERAEEKRKETFNQWLLLVGERFQTKSGEAQEEEEQPQKERWHLFRQTPCELGWAARIIDADREEAAQLLDRLRDWRQVPILAFRRVIELGLPFPDAFFQRSAQENRETAAALVDAENTAFHSTVLDWMDGCDFTSSMSRFQFQFELTMAMLRAEDWQSPKRAKRLTDLFFRLAADYLPNFYSAALLEDEEEWNVLPGMHQFALLLLKGRAAWEAGDELGWVRGLRQALKAAPAMKHMVEFLRRHRPARQSDPQLLELAEKVRAMLAQYAPNDPAVVQLKASPAYQKVAGLLEQGADADGVLWEPESEEAQREFAALEQQCSFSSLEQARTAISGCFQALSQEYQKGLVDYWERYPLWGENKNQVLDHIAQALYEHWTDFAWLYRRLMDNRSRLTMLAVLQNWRSFAVEPLEKVIDSRFDDYFDLEVMSCDEDDVVVDLGAFTGDTFRSYVKNYGANGYKRYYCYEITPESYQKLLRATASYPNVICRRKGAGAGPGELFLSSHLDDSANTLNSQGEERVEVVAMDDDITQPLTLIKMDIEGAEQNALKGCLRHIREDRPKLALSVYHNFEDLWKLARMIDETVPGYRFYLRYHGGNLWPSEISLLALPPRG